jgi:hypothetical protein
MIPELRSIVDAMQPEPKREPLLNTAPEKAKSDKKANR